MTAPLTRLTAIGSVLAALALSSVSAWAQDDPNVDGRAEMERRVQEQSSGGAPTQLTPNMGIMPGENVPLTPPPLAQPSAQAPPQPPPQMRGPRTDDARQPEIDDRRGSPRRDEINRHPREPRYDQPRRDDEDRQRPPRYRPPPVVIRPYYPPPVYLPPPVIVRPYYPPPPFYEPRFDPPPPWVGPVPASVIWDLFPRELYDSLSYGVRNTHERAFIAALSSEIGVSQTWRAGQLRGEITVIDEGFYGSSFCRDVVQTIRTPWFQRTADGRVCLRRGQAWRLVAY